MAANKDHNVAQTSRSNNNKKKNRKQQEAFLAMQQQLGVGGVVVPPAAAAAAPDRAPSSAGGSNNSAMFNTSELLEKHLFASNSSGGGDADKIVAEMLKSSSDPAASFNSAAVAAGGSAGGGLTDRELLERFPSIGSIDLSSLRGPLSRNASTSSGGGIGAADNSAGLFRSGNDMMVFRSSESNLFNSAAWAPQLRSGHEDVEYRPDLLFRTSSTGESNANQKKPAPAAAAVVTSGAATVKSSQGGAPALSLPLSVPPPPRRKTTAKRKRSSAAEKDYISDSITDADVLMGRGGRTNHHKGNEDYLKLKEEIQPRYLAATKEDKTPISQELVDAIHARGGRFLKLDSDTDKWFVVSDHTARKKASQTLREINTPEVRAAKRAKYSKKKTTKKSNKNINVGSGNKATLQQPLHVTNQESV